MDRTTILLILIGVAAMTGWSGLVGWYLVNEYTPTQSIADVLNVFSYPQDTWIPRLIAIWITFVVGATISKAIWEWVNDKIQDFRDLIGI